MASLQDRFMALQRENPNHSSLINFGRTIHGQNLSKRRVIFYFDRLVSKQDYEKEGRKEVLNWFISKYATQEQGFFRQLGYATGEFCSA